MIKVILKIIIPSLIIYITTLPTFADKSINDVEFELQKPFKCVKSCGAGKVTDENCQCKEFSTPKIPPSCKQFCEHGISVKEVDATTCNCVAPIK